MTGNENLIGRADDRAHPGLHGNRSSTPALRGHPPRPRGKILDFNQAESDLSGRKRENVLGKNFFTTWRPARTSRSSPASSARGSGTGKLHTVFPYVFDHEMDPRNVWVTLFYSNETDTAWVFVRDDRRLARPD